MANNDICFVVNTVWYRHGTVKVYMVLYTHNDTMTMMRSSFELIPHILNYFMNTNVVYGFIHGDKHGT